MTVDPVHELPHTSSDPAYCETWAYLLTDLERKTTLLVHASWLPGRGVGNHLVTLQRAGQAPQSLRVESREPWKSELFELEVDPWKNARVRCPRLELDLEFPAFTPPVDFGSLFSLGHGMQQSHVQAGVRATGRIGSERLRAVPGFRDRSDEKTSAPVMRELAGTERRTTHFLERGSLKKPTHDVTPDTPSCLPPFGDARSRDRLGLAAGTTVDISAYGSGLHLTPVGRSARVRTMRGETVAVSDTVITDDDVFAILDADRL